MENEIQTYLKDAGVSLLFAQLMQMKHKQTTPPSKEMYQNKIQNTGARKCIKIKNMDFQNTGNYICDIGHSEFIQNCRTFRFL